jgi:hypothetical protein
MSKTETQTVQTPAEDRSMKAGDKNKAAKGKQIQLTRNVGSHLYGQTFRVADEADAQKLGFKPGDYTFTGA